MKNILIATMFLFSQLVLADVQPAYLKDAVITVTLKNGKTYTYSANEYKVVKRGNELEKSREALVAKNYDLGIQKGREQEGSKKLRLSLYLGSGFTGQDVTVNGNYVDINQKREYIGGLGVSYKFYKDYSVGGTALSNKTYLLNVSRDFSL